MHMSSTAIEQFPWPLYGHSVNLKKVQFFESLIAFFLLKTLKHKVNVFELIFFFFNCRGNKLILA